MSFVDSWALMYVEDSDPSWDSGGGKWYNDDRWDYLRNSYDHEHVCEEDEEAKEAIEKYDFFYILLLGVSWCFDPPSDTPEHGFDPGAAWIEYDDLMILPVKERV